MVEAHNKVENVFSMFRKACNENIQASNSIPKSSDWDGAGCEWELDRKHDIFQDTIIKMGALYFQ